MRRIITQVFRQIVALGSLRNEVGDGKEDFILKYEFALFISLRNYFMSFRVKNV